MSYVCTYLKFSYKERYIDGQGYQTGNFEKFTTKEMSLTIYPNRKTAEGAAYVKHDCCLNIPDTKHAFMGQPWHGKVDMCVIYRIRPGVPFTIDEKYYKAQIKRFVEKFVKDYHSSDRKFKDLSMELSEKHKQGTMPKGYGVLNDGDIIQEGDLVYDDKMWGEPAHYHIGKPVRSYSVGYQGGERDGQSSVHYDPLTIRKFIK